MQLHDDRSPLSVAGLLIKADWGDGMPQVAMQRQLPPFLFIIDTADKSNAVAITLWELYADINSHSLWISQPDEP